MAEYTTKAIGSKYSESFRVYTVENGKIISPFHDIPLYCNENNVNVINEIPRFENGKFEVCKEDPRNPIKQDVKKGKMRFVANLFPSKGYLWNYGALPQTWENPNIKDESTGCKGDNDPLDVIDISNITKGIGEIYKAKIIGCMGMIDEGECDWKIIVIDLKDENAKNIHDIEDLKKYYPELQKYTYNWFRNYKIPDNKPANEFLDGGELKNRDFTMKIIEECHSSWKELMKGEMSKKISIITARNEQTAEEKMILEQRNEPDTQVPENVKGGFFYLKQ